MSNLLIIIIFLKFWKNDHFLCNRAFRRSTIHFGEALFNHEYLVVGVVLIWKFETVYSGLVKSILKYGSQNCAHRTDISDSRTHISDIKKLDIPSLHNM